MLITFPPVLAIDRQVLRSPLRQVAEASEAIEGALANFVHNRTRGFLFQPADGRDNILIITTGRQIPDGYARVLQGTVDPQHQAADLSRAPWIRHPALPRGELDAVAECPAIVNSWTDSFSYVQEDPDRQIRGLRRPQIGAVHAVHAHWTVSDATATIVMPTGTGKTETMLSILTSVGCDRVLVVVPTDALRTQLADKFLTLGALKEPGAAILRSESRRPIVCTLKHMPRTVNEVDELFTQANVIVTTSSIAGQCGEAVQERMAFRCAYLFVDEAHHAEAETWVRFKTAFRATRILQFTATPFREDGKPLDGDIIFKYPLARAQAEGYFRPITFDPVYEFNPHRVDQVIAAKAVERLRVEAHLGHVLMARVDSVTRADQVFQIYSQYPEFNPVNLHSGLPEREREESRRRVISGQARIVVCVDMLGEGFDLPTLKIAAFHDIRKTLAVTLQLAGRFTRARPDLGNATFIANTADVQVKDELRKLYTRDPDWNTLLPALADEMIGEQIALQHFLNGFTEFTDVIPLNTVTPATSAVVYRTTCADWRPENFRAGIHGIDSCEQVHDAVNPARNVLVVVTARRVPLAWSDIERVYDWSWELYVVVWIADQNLLYINSSTNSGEYKHLAEAVCGKNVTLINGQDVFKTFAGVNRLRLQQVGLTEQLGRNVRYTGRMGADVEGGVPDIQRRRAVKSVLSGGGFENAERVTVGASRKGRIWSHRRGRLDELVEWCRAVGAKLLDPNLDPAEVLRGTLEAQVAVGRPNVMPISIDWPEAVYTSPESQWTVVIGNEEHLVGDLEIEIVVATLAGPIRFAVGNERLRVEFELELFQVGDTPNYRFTPRGNVVARIRHGGMAATTRACAEWFYDNPPVVWFADGSSLEGNLLVQVRHHQPPFDRDRIQTWDWTGVNIRKESQGPQREQDSIQFRVIGELRGRDFDVLLDDDDSGEAADIVGVRVIGGLQAPSGIEVHLYHCKFSETETPGRRIGDLYELCGQAQRSTRWMVSHERRTDLFTHLMRREARRMETLGVTRYELGNDERLRAIREISRIWPVSLKVFVVQPGLSKAQASQEQLTLISVTETYLRETYALPLEVIASA
jgi:superfamily II DNA or RNA helicase